MPSLSSWMAVCPLFIPFFWVPDFDAFLTGNVNMDNRTLHHLSRTQIFVCKINLLYIWFFVISCLRFSYFTSALAMNTQETGIWYWKKTVEQLITGCNFVFKKKLFHPAQPLVLWNICFLVILSVLLFQIENII